MTIIDSLKQSPLGRTIRFVNNYDKSLLYSIPRYEKREEIGFNKENFQGEDIWNTYELSWLNTKGKPIVAMATIIVPANSPNIFESKSLKLYLTSLNSTCFDSDQAIRKVIEDDLSTVVGAKVTVILSSLEQSNFHTIYFPVGMNIDHYDIETNCYHYNQDFLLTCDKPILETVYSNLLRSRCPITNQPDWGTVFIQYEGLKINHEGLLKYIVSLRENNEFHEHCIERIFIDISKQCKPKQLSVYARYTRRGGIEINPWRSSPDFYWATNFRLVRQ